MTAPIRIQRRRTKGWKMPENTVYVGRVSKWGNNFVCHHPGHTISFAMSPEMATSAFRKNVFECDGWFPQPLPWPKGKIPKHFTTLEDVKRELRGFDLACWCALNQPCHADVLLEIANS